MPTTKVSPELQAQLDSIIPGKTYPRYVSIKEEHEGKPVHVEFNLNSFVVGMYCAVSFNGETMSQTGDYDNRKLVRGLKKDIVKAIERGATVLIEGIAQVKTMESPEGGWHVFSSQEEKQAYLGTPVDQRPNLDFGPAPD
jgi:hypothetical protein